MRKGPGPLGQKRCRGKKKELVGSSEDQADIDLWTCSGLIKNLGS